jgi:phosphatidate cytidylyltransferase
MKTLIEDRNFLVRAATAVILAPLALLAIYAGGLPFSIVVFMVVLFCGLEFSFMVTKRALVWPINALPLMIFLNIALLRGDRPMAVLPINLIALIISTVLCYQLVYRDTAPALKNTLITLVMMAYVSVVGVAALVLRDDAAWKLLYAVVIVATWFTDIFSYLGGRLYGKRRIVPRISPKKTLEGFLTGIAAAFIGQMVVFVVGDVEVGLEHVAIALFLPLAAIAGDLMISALKRYFGVKDSATPYFNPFPGHGGVLDRLDSFMMVVLCALALAGLII